MSMVKGKCAQITHFLKHNNVKVSMFYSPFVLPSFKPNATCQQDLCFPSFVSVGESPTTFAKGDCLSRSVRGKEGGTSCLEGGKPKFLAQQARPCGTVRSVKVEQPNNCFSKKIAGIEPHNLRSKATCLPTKPFPKHYKVVLIIFAF